MHHSLQYGAVGELLGGGAEPRQLGRGVVVGVRHAQRAEDVLLGEVAQRLPRHLLYDALERDVVQTTVLHVAGGREVAAAVADVVDESVGVGGTVLLLEHGRVGVWRQP